MSVDPRLFQFAIEKNFEDGSITLSLFGRTSYKMANESAVEELINALNRAIHEEPAQ